MEPPASTPAPPVAPSARGRGLRFLLVVLPVVIALSGAMGLILQAVTTSGPLEEASADFTPPATTPDEPAPRSPEGVTAPLATLPKADATPPPDPEPETGAPQAAAPEEPASAEPDEPAVEEPVAEPTPAPSVETQEPLPAGDEEAAPTPTPWPPQARRPGAPRALAANPAGAPGEIALAWLAPLDDGGVPVTGYRLYSGPTADALTLSGDVGDVLKFTDRGLSPGATYFYGVSAVNVKGEGPVSAPASAVAYPEAPPLPTPELPTSVLAALGVALLGAAGLARRRA